MNSLAERLKSKMQEKNVSIQELSSGIGVTYEMIRRYTLGTASPRLNKLEKIANYLQTTASWLQFGIEEKEVLEPELREINLASNVQYILRKKCQSEAALAHALQMDVSTLRDELNDPDQNEQSDFIIALSDELLVSPTRLLYDEISLNPKGINFLKSQFTPILQVPIRGNAQLGDNAYWDEIEQVDGSITWPSRDNDAYALSCRGDSMTPRIKHGEYVIIEPNHRVSNGDEVFVVTEDGRLMVKIYAYESNGRVTLLSINQEHEPIHLDRSEIKKMHYVAGIAKGSLVNDY